MLYGGHQHLVARAQHLDPHIPDAPTLATRVSPNSPKTLTNTFNPKERTVLCYNVEPPPFFCRTLCWAGPTPSPHMIHPRLNPTNPPALASPGVEPESCSCLRPLGIIIIINNNNNNNNTDQPSP